MQKDEWISLQEEFPTVAFNYKGFNGELNDRDHGFRHLYIAEPYSTMPEQWNPKVFSQYDTVITYNEKLYNQYKRLVNMRLVNGCLFCNYELNHLDESEIPSFELKKARAVMINKNYRTNSIGEITWLRPEIANNMNYPLDVYSPQKFGVNYMGHLDSPLHHSHVTQLKKISEYRFCVCLESMYHSFWTWGFLTERMFNCFKTKTIPIYIGCFNIWEMVPKEIFIDFRQYIHFNTKHEIGMRDYDRLCEHMANITKVEFDEMTQRAYEWNKTHEIGSLCKLRELLKELQ